MVEIDKYAFGDDLPKQNPWTDDKLQFRPFAKKIAEAIISMKAPNGFVIGLHGKWGSGKSTTINFILKFLEKHNEENADNRIIHIDFRPWIVSGHHDLIAAFFKVLSENLAPKEVARRNRLKRWLSRVKNSTDPLIDAAATMALAIDPSGGVASKMASGVAKKTIASSIEKFLKDPSLQAAYGTLRQELFKSGKRIFVTIDDIDRLEDAEIRSIMQMAKSVGSLPNLIYLLSYDRDIVGKVFDRPNRRGPQFTEKIVQQEIELPRPDRNLLARILNDEIAFLLELSEDSTRWQFIVRDGIYRWMTSPRDVLKISNAVKFSWPALENEVDPQDLLAIEGLRLFDPEAFEWIKNNKDFLFNQGPYQFGRDDLKTDLIDQLKKSIPDRARIHVLRVMSVLFPQAAKWFEGPDTFGGDSGVEVIKRRGLGSEDGYDAYFALHPSLNAIPRTAVEGVISEAETPDSIRNVFRSYMGKSNSRGELMISKLLEDLGARFSGTTPAKANQVLFEVLLQIGDDILRIEGPNRAFEITPSTQLTFIVRSILEQWKVAQAGENLIAAFKKSLSVAFLSEIFLARGRELGVFPSSSSGRVLIDRDNFDQLGPILLEKIHSGVQDGSLEQAPYFYGIARAWAYLENANVVKEWLSKGTLNSPEFLCKVSKGLVSYSVGTPVRRYTMRDEIDSQFYDLKILEEAAKNHVSAMGLSEDQTNLITEIARGTQKLLKGESSEKTRDADD